MNCTLTVNPLPGETYIRPDAVDKFFKKPYRDYELVEVTFEKRDGSPRTMLCHRAAYMENQVKGTVDTSTAGCMAVCEEGRQWRKVNLNRIMEIRI